MTRRKHLTDHQVRALPIKNRRYFFADPELSGHYVRIMPTGSKTFVAVTRDPTGKQVWSSIGGSDLWKIEESRDEARTIVKRIKKGLAAKEAPPVQPDSFADVAANWIERHVEKQKLISQSEIKRVLAKYIMPTFGARAFITIKRSDVASLLDKIEDQSGAHQADVALSIMRRIANWHSNRDDSYISPFSVKGMKRTRAKPRDRILDDNEIRTVWTQAGLSGSYGALVKLLLLTLQRRDCLRTIRWSDLSPSDDGSLIWTIAKQDRQKGNAGKLKLPDLAVQIINALPKRAGNEFVFASDRTSKAFVGIPMQQVKFAKICALPQQWSLHDLRRTGRSLLARLGINREVAERIMGHALIGVEGTYNRFDYVAEKSHALATLAKHIEDVLQPPPAKVVPMRKAVQ
jgi:integrase